MPIRVKDLHGGRLIRVKGHGILTAEEYCSVFEALYDREKKKHHHWYVLVDFSHVEKLDLSFETVREISRKNIRKLRSASQSLLIAVVTPGVMDFGLAQMWEASLEERRWRTKIFTDAQEAEQWLEKQRTNIKWPGFLSTTLLPPDLEAQFRKASLRSDTKVVMGLMLLSIIFQVLSLPTDMMLLEKPALYLVGGVRSASAVLALVSILLLRKTKVSRFDTVVFIWAFFLLAGVALANAILPTDYTTHVAWDLFLTFAVYTVVPLSLGRQIIAALILTLGDIVLFSRFKELAWPVAGIDTISAFACANIVGIFASRELRRWRRREFRTLRREADIRNHLEKAWREIKTLRGIIPICANCKKIRTDEGLWRQVEAYIQDHTDAYFTHGICPECCKKLYPELEED